MTTPSLDRRRVLAWCLFDFANSNYSAVITVAVFSNYYAQRIVGNEAGLGTLWWSRVVWASMLTVAVSAPLLGAIADRAGIRKRMLLAFTALCVAAVALFPTIRPGMILWGFVLAAVANFAFESAQVYYNAYLPDIAPPERRGFVSGLGFGIGYAGSIAGLVIALPLAARGRFDLVWLSVAAFFAVFSLPSFLGLPADTPRGGGLPIRQAALEGLAGFLGLWRRALARRELRRFLLAYFVYYDGVETVIYFSTIFAAGTLGFTTQENIYLILAVQVSALAGALLLARPTDRWGPKLVVTLVLLLWIAVVVGAYFVQSKATFFALAVVAGTGLGVIQAASRALMASLIPAGQEGEMFGFYAFCGKSSSILGPLVFGVVTHALGGNERAAVLSVGAFFVLGLLLLQRVGTGERGVGSGAYR